MNKEIGKYSISSYPSNINISWGTDNNRQHAMIECTGDCPVYAKRTRHINGNELLLTLTTQKEITWLLKRENKI